MILTDAIGVLRRHNAWRRCPAHIPEDTRPVGVPAQTVGTAIDTVCEVAPDLLAALVSLAATAERYLPDYNEHPDIQRAQDAIARATGEQP